jgi:hypothetical protein
MVAIGDALSSTYESPSLRAGGRNKGDIWLVLSKPSYKKHHGNPWLIVLSGSLSPPCEPRRRDGAENSKSSDRDTVPDGNEERGIVGAMKRV